MRLTPGQLRVNLRISQTALARARQLEARMRRLTGEDIRDGSLTPERYAEQVRFGGRAAIRPSPPPPCRPLRLPAVSVRTGPVAVSAAQLRRDQRTAQDALALANHLRRTIESGGLAAGNVVDGTIAAADLAPGLTVVEASPSPQLLIVVARPAPRRDGGVELSARQLVVNQRIARAAIRRVAEVSALIGRGLPAEAFRPGSLTAQDLAPDARP